VPLAHGAYNARLVEALRRNLLGWIGASPDTDRPPAPFLEELECAVVDHLDAAGPATGAALAAAIPGLRITFEPAPGRSYSKPMRITSRVLELLAAEGRIARGRPTGGGFTSGSWTWDLAARWLGPGGITNVPAPAATAGLVGRYLAAFGPASVTDLAWWTGLPKTAIRGALVECGAAEVRLDGVGEPGWVRPDDDLDAPPVDGAVAVLPGLDSTTMGWKQRAWYVDDDPATGLFDRNGNAGPTIWLDGRVVGTWTQRRDGELVAHHVADVGADARSAVDDELERIAGWLGSTRIRWRYPTPLTKALD
jgi:hypothetical protein